MTMILPRLVVFDLDACCWFPEMYMLGSGSPFRVTDDPDVVVSSGGERVRLYSGVRDAWHELRAAGTPVGVASRCDVPSWACELLRTYRVGDTTMADVAGDLVEIYKGSKKKHFKALGKKTEIPFEDMLFFDDDPWNISEVSQLGVTCVLTPEGITRAVYEKAMADFRRRRGGG
ncbi:hypothetical protein CTAYLR_009973 [Chrysophaeum taylorii]|uniref:Magnesium-dependent phosphatase n=1 Tax=Chrysophaeum taylorii TaxID=2483200 RepID=A0AAD7U6V4_9STRA|nr:hypothetical protein CTAYLR_009973 [Chrysophaeum taylorii]